jgi:hypothetical protein
MLDDYSGNNPPPRSGTTSPSPVPPLTEFNDLLSLAVGFGVLALTAVVLFALHVHMPLVATYIALVLAGLLGYALSRYMLVNRWRARHAAGTRSSPGGPSPLPRDPAA